MELVIRKKESMDVIELDLNKPWKYSMRRDNLLEDEEKHTRNRQLGNFITVME
ncbi:hypothetical protein J4401_06870 [Candidatus Woesearchaeota archaeon]|nr:hypothetical protein [Candidatus Woesearchaeota archaeon]